MTYQLDELAEGNGFWIMGTAAENLGEHKLVYLNAVGDWAHADANIAAKMPVVGFTKHAITSGKRGVIILLGMIGDSSWTWTPGGGIYASTTVGELTQTAPEGLDNIVQRIGVALKSDLIYFDPKLDASEAGLEVHSQQYFVAGDDDNFGNIPAKSITNGQTAYVPIHAPNEFLAIVGFNLYVIPNSTQAAANWDIATTYASNGEAYNTHGETDNTTTYNVTQNEIFEIDCFALGMFADLGLGDVGGISVTVGTAGHDVSVIMGELYYII